MRLNTKIIGVLVVSYVLLSSFLFLTSINSLKFNQIDNIDSFRNEFVEMSLGLFGNNADLFFQYLDNQINNNKLNSTEDLINLIRRIDPKGNNIILVDINTKEFVNGYNNPQLSMLLDEEKISSFLSQQLLNKKSSFEVDNYYEFLSGNASSIPTKIYVRIYGPFGLIVGYGKSFSSGKVRIEYIEKKNEEFYNNSLKMALIFLFITITIIPLISIIMMKRFVIKPINTIRIGFNNLIKGNYNTQIHISSKDEMGELASNFNYMTEELKKSRKKLEEYSKTLEKKVKDRTIELEIKNEELGKFNKLAVGRELKMVELKKKIKELEEKLQKR